MPTENNGDAEREEKLRKCIEESLKYSNSQIYLPPIYNPPILSCVSAQTQQQKIVETAKEKVDSTDWAKMKEKPPYGGAGKWKCNLFVYDALTQAGAKVPLETRWSISNFGYVSYPPLAGQWGDPSHTIQGWVVVTDPQPGDVAAIPSNAGGASGHVGIVSGDGKTISATDKSVVENDWGFRDDQKGTVVFRRYVGQ
ncbi:CHAP domain-containing protein [Azospirillum sp. TSH64]|uniref:CHAP domain-containing protein n=1 Tax=Azospirillum sp. TSH64 TaxID=652740 RepID=UPI0013049626|nr:CHAP domain-containing protein [Azospirillum sp. TSH64]